MKRPVQALAGARDIPPEACPGIDAAATPVTVILVAPELVADGAVGIPDLAGLARIANRPELIKQKPQAIVDQTV